MEKTPGTQYIPADEHEDIVMRRSTIKLFAGSTSHDLVQEIAAHLNNKGYKRLKPGEYSRAIFANENIFIRLNESVRGQDVYLVQTMSSPIHENIFEMLIMIDALKRDSAKRVNVIFPYMSYARSDKKDQPRVPITARLMANLIETAGADRYITIDLHSGQIQGFFNIPGDALTAFHLLSDYVKEQNIPDLVVAAADLGFAKQGRNWAEKLGTRMVIVEKRRVGNAGTSSALSLIGEVEGCNVLLVDDEVLTGGSVVNAINLLREKGAKDIYLAFTHGLLAGNAVQRLGEMNLKQIILTNTIPIPADKRLPNMKILSVGPMLGEVIRRAHEGRSVGELFNE
ncbi:MAG: ribose-phosphate diphosphokinase [Phototrophicaceae bacterium]|jgi:ribose-phosphate pyrophosphokinase